MSTRRSLVLARLYYFASFGATGCYWPYITLFYQERGLAGTAIGLLGALAPIIVLLAGPPWGGLGDRFHIHRWLLPLATVGTVVPTVLLLQAGSFGAMVTLVALAAVFSAPILPLIDSAVLDLIAGTGRSFGNVRVWGSLGFVVGTWITGMLIRAQGLPWLFYGFGALQAVAALVALGLPARRQALQQSYGAGVRALLGQRPLLLFLASMFLVGATLQASYSFYPLHLVANGGNAAWIGLATALGAVTEIPVLFFSAVFFKRLGVRGTLLVGFLLFTVRWAAVALARDPRLILLTAGLHGLTFGTALVGSVAFVERHTPPGLAATAQAVLTAIFFGVGGATGALGGGWLYDLVGAPGLFWVAAGMTLAAVGFLLAARPARTRPLAGEPKNG